MVKEISNLSPEAFLRGLKGLMQENGEFVEAYKQDPTVFAGVRAIQRNIAALEVVAYDSPDPRTRKPATGPAADALNRLLRKPNPWLNGRDFRKLGVVYQVLDGESTMVLRTETLDPVSDESAQPRWISIHPRREVEFDTNGLRLTWRIQGKEVPDEAVIQVKDPDPWNSRRGMGVSGPLHLTSKISWNARSYLSAFFENGADPGGFITSPMPLTNRQVTDYIKQWEQRHGGARKAKKVGILHGGADYKTIQQNHGDMRLLELLKHMRLDALMVIGVPESELGMIKDATYSNGVSANAGFWIQTLLPLALEDEEAYNDPTVGLGRRFGGIYVGYDLTRVKQILQQIERKTDAYTKLVQYAVPPDTAAWLLGLEIPEIKHGKTPFIQTNLTTVEAVVKGATAPQVSGGDDEEPEDEGGDDPPDDEDEERSLGQRRRRALRARERVDVLCAVAERKSSRVVKSLIVAMRKEQLELLDVLDDIERAYSKDAAKAAVVRGDSFVDTFLDAIDEVFEFAIEEAAETVELEIGRSLSVYDIQHPQITSYVDTLRTQVRDIPDSIQKALSETLGEGIEANETVPDLKLRVKATMNAQTKRAESIAQTTSGEAVNGGRYEVMSIEGVAKHEWSSFIDDATRQSHIELDGEVVEIGKPFSNGLRFPLDPQGPADEVVRCRCVALAVD